MNIRLYNGNIANQLWGTGGSLTNTFTYSYDKLNRLIGAAAPNNLGETIGYDVMGNISSLSREGFGTNYYTGYTGNQLTSISGFTNSSYGYDLNGNLASDSQKGISGISYNYLNLPVQVNGIGLSYVYSATGEKLTKVSGGQARQYVNGIEYKPNGTIDIIRTEEGVVRNNGGTYSYEYTLTDHLGNSRASFYKNPVSGQLEVLQRDDYYAFGLRKQTLAASNDNKYLYNGKELQDELGQYDYGARFYDPIIGRWNVVDPLSETSRRYSPYTYGLNNPIRFIDPDGMEATDWVLGKKGIYWDKNANDQKSTTKGDTYLGNDLTFTFNSYINDTFDGPNPPWGAAGDKLTSTINLTSNEDADGNLTSVDVKSSYEVSKTGGLDIFKGRDYFPGLGKDQNMGINITNSNGFNATFEQHASVPGLEAAGLALLGYSSVNVAQKLTLGLSGNNLSVSAATDVFPSATLSVNGNQLFKYNQPSFKGTHGNDLINFGTRTSAASIIGRPAPNFYNRYKK